MSSEFFVLFRAGADHTTVFFREFRGLGIVSVDDAIEKRREITGPGPSLQFYGPID